METKENWYYKQYNVKIIISLQKLSITAIVLSEYKIESQMYIKYNTYRILKQWKVYLKQWILKTMKRIKYSILKTMKTN